MADHLELVLRVLDHQLVGQEDELLGNVDDIELTAEGEALAVTGLTPGAAGLSRRFPGRLGSWAGAIWRLLRPEADPQAVVIPIARIADVGSAIRIDRAAAHEVEASLALEHWLREHVIARIPGATTGGEDREAVGRTGLDVTAPADGDHGSGAGRESLVRVPLRGARWLSSFLGADVVDDSGRQLGRIIEIRCQTSQEPWPITHLHCTRSALGTELGYHSDPDMGPALLRWAMRHWQRHDVLVAVTDIVRVERDPTRVVVVTKDRQHPHAGADANHGGTPDG